MDVKIATIELSVFVMNSRNPQMVAKSIMREGVLDVVLILAASA